MGLWEVEPHNLSYGPKDTAEDVTKVALAVLARLNERELDKDEKLANAELTLLAGELADSRDDVRRSKLLYQQKLDIHEDLLGPSNRVEYTSGGQKLSKDILGRYTCGQ